MIGEDRYAIAAPRFPSLRGSRRSEGIHPTRLVGFFGPDTWAGGWVTSAPATTSEGEDQPEAFAPAWGVHAISEILRAVVPFDRATGVAAPGGRDAIGG